jgi:hypothetical protein
MKGGIHAHTRTHSHTHTRIKKYERCQELDLDLANGKEERMSERKTEKKTQPAPKMNVLDRPTDRLLRCMHEWDLLGETYLPTYLMCTHISRLRYVLAFYYEQLTPSRLL